MNDIATDTPEDFVIEVAPAADRVQLYEPERVLEFRLRDAVGPRTVWLPLEGAGALHRLQLLEIETGEQVVVVSAHLHGVKVRRGARRTKASKLETGARVRLIGRVSEL